MVIEILAGGIIVIAVAKNSKPVKDGINKIKKGWKDLLDNRKQKKSRKEKLKNEKVIINAEVKD